MPVAEQVNVTGVPITTATLLGGTVITGGTAVKPCNSEDKLNDITTGKDCIITLQVKNEHS